jgi:sulfite exporter TauE/SafE/copper chaperone CopZ
MNEVFQIKGMHCRSCELLIEEKVKEITGVQKVKASTKKNEVIVISNEPVTEQAVKAIQSAGYYVGAENLPVFSSNVKDYEKLGYGLIIFLLLVIALRFTGLSNLLDFNIETSTSLPVVFVIGLVAGISSCMALVGGLILAVSAKYSEKNSGASLVQKFRPHIFFNLGRILSYFLLGALIGYFGSFFRLSGSFLGFVTLAVGLIMLFLGLELTGIFPKLTASFTLPKGLSRLLKIDNRKNQEYSHLNSAILGSLTFFLPCGFTQAMQALSIQSGKPLTGALVMGVFALGTTPGLLGIGGISAAAKKGIYSQVFFRFVGVLLVALAFFNLSSGYALSGLNNYVNSSKTAEKGSQTANKTAADGARVIEATYAAGKNITPSTFEVKRGQLTRIEILAKTNGSGCMGSVMIPGLVDTPQFFTKGKKTVLEFHPVKTGFYEMTCAMGIKSGTIKVIN